MHLASPAVHVQAEQRESFKFCLSLFLHATPDSILHPVYIYIVCLHDRLLLARSLQKSMDRQEPSFGGCRPAEADQDRKSVV